MAWDVLENVVVGAFIFGFGRALGVRFGNGEISPVGLELLQQTPMDTRLGDVLIANSVFVRLIEFKRELNASPKERAKLLQLREALKADRTGRLIPLSRSIHWYVSTNFNKWENSRIVPYLDMDTLFEGCGDLADFVRETADALTGQPLSEQELIDVSIYMDAVATYCGSGKIGATTGGLLFTVNAQGKASYIPIRDVRELAMSPQMVIEQRRVLQQELTQKAEQEHKLKRGRKRQFRMER